MKKITFQPGEVRRYGLAAAAGLLLAAAFPKWGVAGLGWLAPGLILATTLGMEKGAAFRIGYVAGMAHCLASLYWLLFIPVALAPIAGWVALAAYQAFYTALWVYLCWAVHPADLVIKLGAGTARPHSSRGDESSPPRFTGSTGETSSGGILSLLDRLVSASWPQRLAWGISCAALWVAGEMIEARLFSGFPWNFLGASQYRMLPIIQLSSVTGVYGVSFLMAWFSAALLCAAAVVIRQPTMRRVWMGELIVPLMALIAAVTFGLRQSFAPPPAAPTLKVALIQPSIPQKMIWDPGEANGRFKQLLELSEKALQSHPELLIWPEAAVPNVLRFDTNNLPAITNLVRAHKIWLILGADDVMWRPNSVKETDYDYYNSSFLISPEGELVALYQKRKLVIFGEYLPLRRWLPFLESLTGLGSFAAGTKAVPFDLPDLKVKTSVLICFEDLFPHLVREDVQEDTDFLVNLTNNGWFGESAAQWQHAANAVFRAVENGLPLVRCTNNGLTCWIDARGRMHEVYFPGSRDIYQVGFKLANVPVLAGHPRNPTFYRQHGDCFGWACVGFSFLRVGATRFARGSRVRQSAAPAKPA